MNINEYKEKEATEYSDNGTQYDSHVNTFKEGFDCAMNLGIAVKFAEWKRDNPFNWQNREMWYKIIENIGENWTMQQLFNYWITNIFKIE